MGASFEKSPCCAHWRYSSQDQNCNPKPCEETLSEEKLVCSSRLRAFFWELVSSDVPGEDGGVLEPWEDVQIEAGPLDTCFSFFTLWLFHVISCYFT